MKITICHPLCGKTKFKRFWTLFSTLLLISACGSQKSQDTETGLFDPNKDYFPDKVEIQHSIGFDVEYANNYKTLHFFRHYNDLVDTVSYALVQKGTPSPLGFDENRIIQIPVQKVVSLSTTHLTMFEMLDAIPQLIGVETAQYIYSDRIRKLIDDKEIFEASPAGPLNVETIVDSGTEVVLGVGYPNSKNENFQQLEIVGIPVLLNTDWQERDLLGRAEWVKLMAVLLNKEKLVNQQFSKIENEYQSVLNLLDDKVEIAPLTITGIAQGDSWHVAGGKSFAHNVLRIAKADYPWKEDQSTGSLKLAFETVYELGLKAKFWVGPSHARTLDQILARDSRYADFEAFKTGQVYNIYGKYIEGGGNDYYESGVMNPHIIIKDVVKIFHPELLPNHDLVYYSRLK